MEPFELAQLLCRSDLSAKQRRAVRDAVVSSMIEGDVPSRESVLLLIELAGGHLNFDEYKRQVLKART